MSTLALEPLFDTNLDGDARVAVPDGESGGELTLEALVSAAGRRSPPGPPSARSATTPARCAPAGAPARRP